jgi:signal transduction histidine kinase
VQKYGGQVWVEDVEPHGARFVVDLPAIQQDLDSVDSSVPAMSPQPAK